MPVLHQSSFTSKAGTTSLWLFSDKEPNVSGSDKNIKTPCNTKLKLTELNDWRFKTTEKLAKTNVCNSKTLTLQSKRYTFRSFLNIFTVYTEVYITQGFTSQLTDARVLQSPLSYFKYHFILRDCKSYILVQLSRAFQNQANLVLCIIGSD